MMRRRSIGLAAMTLAFVACATLGAETDFPDIIQSSGAGPFRLLTAEETGGLAAPNGRIYFNRQAVQRSMVADGMLFYDGADEIDEPPDRNPDLPEGALDFAQLGPSRIFRSEPRPVGMDVLEGALSFNGGPMVLEASEAWEGESVFDPWVHVDDDGTARLYYAAEGGIGVAEASSAGGAFSKVAGPVITDARSPTVVRFGGELVMLFEATDTGTIGLARSSDGRAFTEDTRELDLALAGESELARPGAVVATTPTGRTVLRVYFEAVGAEDLRIVTLAATVDLDSWDRLESEIGVLSTVEGARAPAPLLLDDGITALTLTRPRESRGVEVHAVCGAMAPAHLSLVDAPEPAAEE